MLLTSTRRPRWSITRGWTRRHQNALLGHWSLRILIDSGAQSAEQRSAIGAQFTADGHAEVVPALRPR